MDSNLSKRIAFAAAAIPVAVLVVWYGGWPLAVLVSVVAALGVRELFDIAEARGATPLRPNGEVIAALVPLLVYASISRPEFAGVVAEWWPYGIAVVVIAWLIGLLVVRSAGQRPLSSIAVTIFGVLYAAVLPSFLLGIRHGQFGSRSWPGVAMVFFPLVVIWVCDSAAMFGGRAMGGPKLAPTISPGKTRSGGMAGVIGGVAVAPLFALIVFPRVGITLSLGHAIGMALALSIVGQLGDLAESLFKREAGVKDSSSLIPGHGGVLDRFDALYVGLPVAAIGYKLAGLM